MGAKVYGGRFDQRFVARVSPFQGGNRGGLGGGLLSCWFLGAETSGGNPSARGYAVAPSIRTLRIAPILYVVYESRGLGGYLPP